MAAARSTKTAASAGDARSRALEVLRDWSKLNKVLMKMDEEEVGELLEVEKGSKGRLTFLLRLQARLNKLRRERERKELAAGAHK